LCERIFLIPVRTANIPSWENHNSSVVPYQLFRSNTPSCAINVLKRLLCMPANINTE
jgi:hypothetical protein